MRYHFLLILLFFLLSSRQCALAQESETLIDSVALQERIDSEINAFREWQDSMARAKGLIPQDKKVDEIYPGSEMPTRDELLESERKLSQFKKIIVGLFVLVMLIGMLLSKPWKKKKNSN